MYKGANTVYPILQEFIQKAYPVINRILGKMIPWAIPNIPEKTPTWAAPTHIYSKSLQEYLKLHDLDFELQRLHYIVFIGDGMNTSTNRGHISY